MLAPSPLRGGTKVFNFEFGDIRADRLGTRKVVSVNRSVDGVVFNGCDHVEACLLEAEREAPGASKQVYCCGSYPDRGSATRRTFSDSGGNGRISFEGLPASQ
jgi:hypothetical protein